MPLLTLPQPNVVAPSVRAKAMVFEDPSSQALLARIRQVAPSEATVLVRGETGTGKEIVARHVHDLSRRAGGPFVAVNCGAFAQSLVESELFGHEKGAFTGAHTAKAGWFESARGGTLFLDEIGDLPLDIQVKLLRVLQEREVVRIGARQPIPIDVRLIAATNVDLEAAVSAGHFREDLYYRVDVASLVIRPLRERPGDILPLVRHFLAVYADRLGCGPTVTTPAAEKRLLEHSFPGNIRELENVVHHALLVCHGNAITPGDLRLTTMQPRAQAPAADVAPQASSLEEALTALFEQDMPRLYEHVENTLVRCAYRYCENNQLQTARLLGISRNVVRARLIQCGELSGSIRPPPVDAIADAPRDNVRSMAPSPRPRPAIDAPRVMRIGHQPFGLLTHVKTRGELERVLSHQGVAVMWKEFSAGMPIMEALRNDELDCGVVGEVSPIVALASGFPVVHLTAGPPVPEGEAIIVHDASPIRSVADLRGRTVVLQQGSNVHYLLFRALEEAGLRHDDVRVTFAAPDDAHTMFMNDKADAWAIWDPWLASVQAATHARVLRDGRGLASNAAHYVARRGFAEAHADWVACFVKEIHAVSEWAFRDGHALASVASQLRLPRAAITTALRRRREAPLEGGELLASQQRVADALLRWRVIQVPVTVSDAQWPGGAASSGSAAVAV